MQIIVNLFVYMVIILIMLIYAVNTTIILTLYATTSTKVSQAFEITDPLRELVLLPT